MIRPIGPQPPFRTIDEVAEYLSVSRSTVYGLVSRNELICFKIAGCIRVHESDLQEYLQSQRRGELPPAEPSDRRDRSVQDPANDAGEGEAETGSVQPPGNGQPLFPRQI